MRYFSNYIEDCLIILLTSSFKLVMKQKNKLCCCNGMNEIISFVFFEKKKQ